jgi:hypothetical protein
LGVWVDEAAEAELDPVWEPELVDLEEVTAVAVVKPVDLEPALEVPVGEEEEEEEDEMLTSEKINWSAPTIHLEISANTAHTDFVACLSASLGVVVQGILQVIIAASVRNLLLQLVGVLHTGFVEVRRVRKSGTGRMVSQTRLLHLEWRGSYPTAERRQAGVDAAAAMLVRAKKEKTMADLGKYMAMELDGQDLKSRGLEETARDRVNRANE